MITVDLSWSELIQTRTIRNKFALEFPHSFTNGNGMFAGTLGELIFTNRFYGEWVAYKTYDHDVIWEGKKIDVKTLRCASVPLSHYDGCVPDNTGRNLKEQDVDHYVFCRVLEDYSRLYIMGIIEKERFWHEAEYHEKGEFNGFFAYKENTWTIPYSTLEKLCIAEKV